MKVFLSEPGGSRVIDVEPQHVHPVLGLAVAWFDRGGYYMGDLIYSRVYGSEVMVPEAPGVFLPVYTFRSISPNAAYTRFIGLEQ